jgi:ketosteroid isomerase-like protein
MEPGMTETDVRTHLLSRYQDWMTAIATKDIDEISSLYASDAVYMPPAQPRLTGKEAVVAKWRENLERTDFTAIYTPSLTISSNLELAYDVGSYALRLTRNGVPIELKGKYVVIWKVERGRWVVAVDIDNSDSAD